MMLLALISLLASAVLLCLALLRGGRGPDKRKDVAAKRILVDGSNVMHWKNEQPQMDTVREVLAVLKRQGYNPGVMFDANVGYKIGSRYLDDRHLATLLDLPEQQVLVVPKGTPADQFLLESACKLGAKVVTNDRFRDWAEIYPEVHAPGFLIRGGFSLGKLWLDRTLNDVNLV